MQGITDSDEEGTQPRPAPRTVRRARGQLQEARRCIAVEYLLTVAVGWIVSLAVAAHSFVWWLIAGGVSLAYLTELVSLPSYGRARSLQPLRRIASVAATLMLLGTAAGELDAAGVRDGVVVLSSALWVALVTRLYHRRQRSSRSTLLVGNRKAVSHFIAQWGDLPEITIVGICLAEPIDNGERQLTQLMALPVVGNLQDVPTRARELNVEQVVVAPGPALDAYDVRRLNWALEDSTTELAVATEIHGAVPSRIEPRLLRRRLLLFVRPTRRPRIMVWSKSLIDRVVASVLLVLLTPLLIGLVVLIRLDSAGPGFYRQARVGRNGELFTMVKLRTMRADADQLRDELNEFNEGAGPLFKLHQDPRITGLGRFLRRTSLDEMPQLFNVVKGDMSLVGPRPALPNEIHAYDGWIRRRLSVKPGMTGLWQVSGRSRLSWAEAVRLDLDYVDNWTLTGDLAIFARTVSAVARRDGAT